MPEKFTPDSVQFCYLGNNIAELTFNYCHNAAMAGAFQADLIARDQNRTLSSIRADPFLMVQGPIEALQAHTSPRMGKAKKAELANIFEQLQEQHIRRNDVCQEHISSNNNQQFTPSVIQVWCENQMDTIFFTFTDNETAGKFDAALLAIGQRAYFSSDNVLNVHANALALYHAVSLLLSDDGKGEFTRALSSNREVGIYIPGVEYDSQRRTIRFLFENGTKAQAFCQDVARRTEREGFQAVQSFPSSACEVCYVDVERVDVPRTLHLLEMSPIKKWLESKVTQLDWLDLYNAELRQPGGSFTERLQQEQTTQGIQEPRRY